MKYIVIIGAVLSVALYYIIAEVIWQLRSRSFRRRLIIGVLIMALLASQIDFISIFTRTDADRVAAAEADTESGVYAAEIAGNRDTESKSITAFAKLPDSISKQAVPVGTALEELVLPDTLEAVCVKADTDADTDTKTDADASNSQMGGGSGDQGDSEEVVPSEDSGQEDETPKNPDENSEEEKLSEEEKSSGTEDKITETQSAADTEMQTETGSFTMPEYRTGNVIEVKTLEMAPAANYGSIEETIIIENIAWQSEPEYDGDAEGEYIFTAILPEGYVLTDRVNTPQITVTVGGTDDTALLSGDGIMPIAETHTTHDGIATAWTNPTSLPSTAGSYYLDTDVTLSMRWQPSANITLCLNGHTIEYNNSFPAIDVKSGGILDIYDCKGSGTVTNSSDCTLQINDGGTANIYGGEFISNGIAPAIQNGKGGTLTMSGGEITYANGRDGIDNSGDAHVKNVKIKQAGSNNGDGVGIYCRGGGTITVEDCEIESGTGVCVYVYYGTAKIIGGTFNGGYGIHSDDTIELSGSPTISSSTADIYLLSNRKITVTDSLSNTTPYSVRTQTKPTEGNPVVFTDSSTTSYNDTTKFKAAEDGYIVRKNSSGQLELVKPAVHTHNGITFEPWTSTTSLPDTAGSYYLYDDVTISDTWAPRENTTLCLNGHTIDNPTIDVKSGGSLNIYDCQGDGKVTNSKGNVLYIRTNGIANIYGGTFNSTDYPTIYIGGTVTIENATVSAPNANAVEIDSRGMATINGGTFENNSSQYAPIYARTGSSLKITGGTVKSNGSYMAIEVDPGSTAIITGGKFISNSNNVIQNSGTIEMSGGTVTGTSTGNRGAVGIANAGIATIKNVTITTEGTAADDDTLADKGLYNTNGGTMTVENCNVTSTNRAVWNTGTGGSTIKISSGTFKGRYGMYNNNGTFELSGSPTFAGSTADIYLSNNQTIAVTGTLGNATPYSVLTQTNPTADSPVVITDSSTTSYNVAAKFTAADSRYAVSKNNSGQLELAVIPHTHDGITFEPWTDTETLPTSGNYYLDTDVTLSVWLETSANLNLCLNGHTITYDGLPIRVRSGGTLGIYDCQGNGAVMATVSSASCIRIFSGGTVDIYGGTFNSVDYAAINVEGTVTIKNANVFGANAVQIEGGGMATINGGIFKSFSSYPTISLEPSSTGIITGGTFIQNDGTNIIQNQGTLEMSGGTVTGRSTDDRGISGILNYGASATATIKNVTITTVGTATDDDTKADKGLRNDNGGTMIVENCNITSSNRAVWNTGSATIKISSGTFNGRYGIYNNNGIFELSGSPTFTGSTADIYLSSNQKITVTGTLGNAAPYSVLTQTNPTADSPVVITDSSTTSYNVAAKFTAANSRYTVSKNSSGQLELAVIPHTHDGITFEPWTDTETLPTSGSYYLEDDVTLDRQCVLSDNANTTLNLCLDGHTITYPLWNPPICVGSSNTLNIYDCQDNGKVTTNDSNTLYIASGGTANIYGGTFVNPTTSPNIAILGTVTIYGGTFESTNGVTISVQPNASLKITDGTFIRNNGGNVIQNQGTLEMSGGTVTGKSTSTSGAVGIVNSGTSATATIKNVTVTTEGTATDDDTKADKGLRNDNGGTMTVENCDINSSNWAVWNTGGSTIKISGGTFNGRYGVYNNNGKFELSGSPTISGSTADIYLSNGQKITVTGNLGNAAPYSVLTQTNPAVGSPVEITDSSNTSYNNADKFTPANNSYILRKNSSSQLELAMLATYTITYNAGSYGSGSVSSGTKTEGVDYTLSSDTFTRTGYTQTGWSKNSNGSTKDYALGAKYTDDVSITLYPYWTANQYTVSFNSAGGNSVSNKTVTFDGTYGDLATPTRTGYKFDGWYTAETGGTKVESNTKVTIADDHTLYAKWTANEYGITYMDQGGAAFSGTHESGYPTKHTYGTATTLKSATKTGFTFSGWYTNSSCTGSAVTSLGATGYTSDITLYAKWTGPEYDITYMDQGGAAFSGTHESGYPTKHAYGTATTLKSASKAGYTFNGWYTDSSCTNKVTSLGATDYTSDITLYAKWTEGTAPPKTEGGSSSGGGGSTGGNSGGSSSGGGNGSQPSDNNSGGSSSEDTPSDSATPSTGTAPPKTGTVETKTPDPDSNKEQKEPSGQKTDHEKDTASPVETESVTEPQKEQTKDAQIDTTALTVGEGTVRVTVVSDGYQYAAGVTDTEAVADAVLTPEQIQLVSGGESIEIRVEVTDISDQVSQQDRDIIEGGLANYKITGDTDGEGELTLGAYIDISMYIRIGDGDWDAITKAGEPIEVVIGIPDDLLSDERTYYIARSHEGEFALLNDLDNEPDTITIKTELFSTYAIVYRQMSGTGADGFPGFLASLSWAAVALWSLGILVMLGIVIFLIFWKRRKEEEEEVS